MSFILLSGMVNIAFSQGCDSARINFICPGDGPMIFELQEDLGPNFFMSCNTEDDTLPCDCADGAFSFDYNAFFTFHTNTIAPSGQVNIDFSILDCDFNTEGDNSMVKAMIMPIPPADRYNPCVNASLNNNPVFFQYMTCVESDSTDFSLVQFGCLPDQDYMLVIGSDHDSTNGPCQLSVEISGTGVEINASVDKLGISLGESVQLNVEGADSTSSINWTPPEFLDNPSLADPLAIPEVTTVFQVNAEVGPCKLSDFVSVKVGPPIDPFTAFSPNNDGVNETWKIRRIELFEQCQIQVFDRWGQSVFKSIGYEQPWDGTNAGKPLPTGPYYFVIELNSFKVTIPPITGVVSLLH